MARGGSAETMNYASELRIDYPAVVLLVSGAVWSAWEDRCFAVPKGQARIAQRFNAGLDAKTSKVPKGRLRSNPTLHPSAVPSGLVCYSGYFPALKRRAILKLSLRDKGKRRMAFPLTNSCLSGRFSNTQELVVLRRDERLRLRSAETTG